MPAFQHWDLLWFPEKSNSQWGNVLLNRRRLFIYSEFLARWLSVGFFFFGGVGVVFLLWFFFSCLFLFELVSEHGEGRPSSNRNNKETWTLKFLNEFLSFKKWKTVPAGMSQRVKDKVYQKTHSHHIQKKKKCTKNELPWFTERYLYLFIFKYP